MRTTLAVLALAAFATGCAPVPGWMLAQRVSAITDYQHFANAPIAHAAQPSPLPSKPSALHWPQKLDDAALDQWLAANGTVAFLVVRRGELVAERYYNGYRRDSIFTTFSMAKSVVSSLVGVANGEGKISLDDPVTKWLPELRRNDVRFDRITLGHLARMRSGIAFDEGYGSPFTEAARFYLTEDFASELAKLQIEREPNQAYKYSSGDTQLLAMALERAVGRPLPAYLEEKIWQPMGAEYDASWSLDRAGGEPRAFCCLNARAVDYARFGLVFLHEGRFNGRQIVPAAWVRDSTSPQSDLPGRDEAARRNIEWRGTQIPRAAFYGWQWRRAPTDPIASNPEPSRDFYAQGLHGQVMLVSPDTQTVVLRLGQRTGDVHWPSWLQQVARLNP